MACVDRDGAWQDLNLEVDADYMVMAWSKPSVLTLDSTSLNVPELSIPLYIVLAVTGPTAGKCLGIDGCATVLTSLLQGDEVYVAVPQEAWDASKGMSFHAKLNSVDWNLTEPVDLGFSSKGSIQLPECANCPLADTEVVFWNGEQDVSYNLSKFDLWYELRV